MSKFANQIIQFDEKVLEALQTTRRETAIRLFSAIINDTPVDKGRAKGNWQPSLNTPATGIIDTTDENLGLNKVLNMDYGTDEDIWLVNNLPYIAVIEYGLYPKNVKRGSRVKQGKKWIYVIKSAGGYSKKSPQGMVRKNVARFEQIFKEALMKIK